MSMTPGPDDYIVSTDAARLDLDFICTALAGTYWAQDRPRSVEESIRASLCFGAYQNSAGAQVGLARVVTDGATFSWLCDVVVHPGHRGRGVGKLLMAAVGEHPRLKGTTFLLGTRDAHGLYEKFGFVRSEMMRRLPTTRMPTPSQDTLPPGAEGRTW